MLNISKNSIKENINLDDFSASDLLKTSYIRRLPVLLFAGLFVIVIACLFLPWTQNITTKGYVTTLLPDQRPQSVQSVIPGRIEKWYIREGDYVERGDTIVFLSEVKSEYFDPELQLRTAEQIAAKEESVGVYGQKVRALKKQYDAIKEALSLKQSEISNKIKQAENKVKIDSIDLAAYVANLEILNNQLSRTEKLYDKGLKTLTEVQDKQYKAQSGLAKVNAQRNKLLNQRNEVLNLQLSLRAVEKDYVSKLAKSESEQQSALSAQLESQVATAKLKSKLSSYNQRQQHYYITAPQSGYIVKTLKKGIGETVKAGADVSTIMPASYDLAVEVYVEPKDLPLLNLGNGTQLRFDGWPAIVISGWPASSTGVFEGEIVAIDKFIGDNGYYRVLISPSEDNKTWPEKLSVGTGVNAFVLLKEVPIWYELWRQLNGFPADFYRMDKNKEELKRKAPLKSVK